LENCFKAQNVWNNKKAARMASENVEKNRKDNEESEIPPGENEESPNKKVVRKKKLVDDNPDF